VFSTAAGLQQFVAGTASIAPATPDALVERAVRLQSPVEEDRPGYVTAAAAPVLQDGTVAGVVLVTVSLAPVARLRAEGRVFAIGLALVSMLGLVGLIHLLAERLVHRPLRGVVNAVGRARRGDLSARATVFRDDEIGEVAVGLNTMLTELEELHQSLQQRVDAATRELRERNEQIVRSHESVLTLREALARAQALAAIGQTMANVAHQIGTPLNLVSAHVQLMQQESQDPAVRRRLQIVEDQIERVTSSVRALLDRARPYAIKRDVPLEPLLKRLVEGLQVQAAATGVTTQVDVAGPLPSVMADETQLELALLNLMANALDAMPGGGRLTIVAAASPDAVTIAVRDTGIGIPPGLSERMFEPWVTTKPPGQGTGLGLTITREVIERSGGTIAVENRAGGGTVFRVTLPRAEAKEYRP